MKHPLPILTFLLLILLLLPLNARNQKQSHIISFSDNGILNEYICEAYAYSLPSNYTPSRVSVCFGFKTKSGRYYNYVRIGDEMKGRTAYVELISELFDTYEEAISKSKKYVGVFESPEGLIKCDFSNAPDGFSKSVVCNYYDITNLDNSPNIKQYMQEHRLLVESSIVKSKALNNSINGKDTYQCIDQFADLSDVVIYRNGWKVSPEKYTLYKQGKVQFKDYRKVRNGNVYFKYTRNVKNYQPISNDLSQSMSMFSGVYEGGSSPFYSFTKDPTGDIRDVLLISFNQLSKDSKNARQQFSLGRYPMTRFKDRIKLFVPTDMEQALLSYPKRITWFSIQGSWCQFGSAIGQTNDMYSGSASSLDIVKPTVDSKYLYFNIRCRRRHCDVNTGLEEYDVLSEETSSFPVKSGEWITIEREWRVGNPGVCKHTIIDSDGKHEFFVDAYNCVCDPENESVRYGDKYAGENPYNYCFPFICKIYTSKELAQYCIDTIGKCYLYYKDYELIEAENVNAFVN